MNSIRTIQKLNERELEAAVTPEGSWHTDYRDTAFIYIGGLPFELSEGDIITIVSQYGEPVWIKLARDKETGKSRGFAWIKYEDQRSCDLAVDNLGGATVMDRVLRVDHARYKPRDNEDMRDNTMGELDMDPGNDSDGKRKRRRRRSKSESNSDHDRALLPEEMELNMLMDELDVEDPMRESMIKQQQEKVDHALRKLKKQKLREKDTDRKSHRHRRIKDSRDHQREGSQERRRKDERERRRDHSRERRRDPSRVRRRDPSRERRRDPSRERRRDPSRERRRDPSRERRRDPSRDHREDRSRERRRNDSRDHSRDRDRRKDRVAKVRDSEERRSESRERERSPRPQ